MWKRLGVPVLVGAGLLVSGCASSKADVQRAEAPPVGAWDGAVRGASGDSRGWTDDVVGSDRHVTFRRVDAHRWQGGGHVYEVDGRFLRGGGRVVELEELADGWRVTVRGPLERRDWTPESAGPQPVRYQSESTVTVLRRFDGLQAPDAQGYVRVATVRTTDIVRVGPDAAAALPGLYVRASQAEGGLPWPQVGLALMAMPWPGH